MCSPRGKCCGKRTQLSSFLCKDLPVLHDRQTVSISSFSAYVEREIVIPDGVQTGKITTAVIVDSDGSVRHVPTRIIMKSGKYCAIINSLTNSTYAIVYHPFEFADAANRWAKNSVNDMGSRMVVFGDENGNYNSDKDVTRAEFAAIVVRGLGLAPKTGESSFSDVRSTDWYCGYAETASKYGIVTGYGDGTFGPDDKITGEQGMAMVARAMKITGLKVSLTGSDICGLLGAYTDGALVSDYATDSVAACIKTGIVTGESDNMIVPKDCVTRAEAAVMVERLLQKSGLI